jgi:hypothetical protein
MLFTDSLVIYCKADRKSKLQLNWGRLESVKDSLRLLKFEKLSLHILGYVQTTSMQEGGQCLCPAK